MGKFIFWCLVLLGIYNGFKDPKKGKKSPPPDESEDHDYLFIDE